MPSGLEVVIGAELVGTEFVREAAAGAVADEALVMALDGTIGGETALVSGVIFVPFV